MTDVSFINNSLDAHNAWRKKHGCPPLKHNKDISKIAQKWAEHLAKIDGFEHSKPAQRQFKGDQMGENIAMKWTSTGEDFTGQQSTDNWYSEIEKYNFRTASGPGTGHFTQVVWKGSEEFGVGKAKTAKGKWLVVANYHPAGNFIGRYPENVPAPTDGKVVVPGKDSKPSGGASASPSKMSATPKPLETTGTSTSRSIRKEMTRGADGKVVTKTITTETTTGPDGEKKTKVTEEITEGDEAEQAFASGGESDKEKKKPQKMKDFIDEVVKFHNKYRKTHGKAGDIKHNKELDVLAQSWADHMASTGKLEHSNANYKGEQLGENVATKWSSVGADYTGQEVVDQWYSENSKYDFSGDWQQGCGHFSQVVWKGSKEVGIGKAFGKDGRVFVVSNYHPAGNILGRFKDNVSAAKK